MKQTMDKPKTRPDGTIINSINICHKGHPTLLYEGHKCWACEMIEEISKITKQLKELSDAKR